MFQLPHHAALLRQYGSSAVEFTLVAIPILLIGLGAIELSRWFFVKQAISLALLEAGRAGIVDHARPNSIEAAFEHALLPLFPPTTALSATQQLQNTFDRRHAATGVAPWRIQLQSPNAAVFQDFSVSGLSIHDADGLAVINNHYQAEQHEHYKAQGRPNGRGPVSGATIFEANNLALHLTYMHEPLVPGVRALLQMLSTGSSGYAQQALAGGYLPLTQTLHLTMQSHPVDWPSDGFKVVTTRSPATEPAWAPAINSYCSGIWCPAKPVSATHPGQSSPLPRPPTHAAAGPDLSSTIPAATGPPASSELPGLPEADDALCGIVVCCI